MRVSARPALLTDVEEIAAIHVTCWQETYSTLLPASEIARQDIASRSALWRSVIGAGTARVALIPGAGFAAMGPQRDASIASDYPDELLAIYVLSRYHGQGHGRALLAAVRGNAPFSAWVLGGNARAQGFYARLGGAEIRRQSEVIDGFTTTEILLGFSSPQGMHDIPQRPAQG